jgi:hypothetical protein
MAFPSYLFTFDFNKNRKVVWTYLHQLTSAN